MSITFPEEAHSMEAAIACRPNGVRVLRLLRETLYLDGKLSSSLRGVNEFPVVTAALAMAALLLTLIAAITPSVQYTQAEASEVSTVDPVQAHMQPTPGMELTYQPWLHQSHEQVTRQAPASLQPEAF